MKKYLLVLFISLIVAFPLYAIAQEDMGTDSEPVTETVMSEDMTESAEVMDENTADVVFLASANGTKYHIPTCPAVKTIKEENLQEFTSQEQAEAAGYEACKICMKE